MASCVTWPVPPRFPARAARTHRLAQPPLVCSDAQIAQLLQATATLFSGLLARLEERSQRLGEAWVDPAMIGAIAALLTAATGLAAKLVSSKPAGKPWMVGIATLAIVGVVLLIVALVPPTDTRNTDQVVYQNYVVSICTEDRETNSNSSTRWSRCSRISHPATFRPSTPFRS